MSEESDLEKTESATPKRLQKAREQGQIPHSRELVSFALLAAGFFGVYGMSGSIYGHMQSILRGAFTFDRVTLLDTHQMMIGAANASKEGLLAIMPVFAMTAFASLAAPMALGGFLLTTEPLAPNFNRLNPITGLGRIFSMQGPVQLGMSLLKTIVVSGIAGFTVWKHRSETLDLLTKPLPLALADAMHLIALTCGMAIAGLFLVAAADVPYQMYAHAKKLRMTKEEVKQEHKENDGDPHIKAKIRSQQRAASRRRMMQQVPTADVIVTNPTHFAVALKYTDGEMRAPRVVANGVDLVAARIRELGREANVPLLEAPPLARALYHNVELNREIPGALYGAVAQVLAWVYQLKRYKEDGGDKPDDPTDLDVPKELDKGMVSDADADQEAADALMDDDNTTNGAAA
ncbi:Flagellar biosynthesis protein FlhB [Candidatus Burkholderia verschuerenii]|uniref:Flagellar biosynthetic protein FlhB n=1 Tax=Candidatus Burkholderia verschuerenii TaxID=242163 RepID=A0A0L0MDU9_9BURK|nr:flagellar biosynthesis protein FlhB [Candidatus Burkholderia verschuerenii]KND60882.1 Flagellar biosynthesis protein FlhB [Candidatus Burkholderia verschuerenii]